MTTAFTLIAIILDAFVRVYFEVNQVQFIEKASIPTNSTSSAKIIEEQTGSLSKLFDSRNILMPFYPNFLNYFCKAFGMMEGIAIMPQTLAQARHHDQFIPIISIVQYSIGSFSLLFGVLCYLAYGP